MTFSGWVATLAGWYVTEIGRQPWLVYGVLPPPMPPPGAGARMIAITLAMYLTLVYAAAAVAYVVGVFHLARKAARRRRHAARTSGAPAARSRA
jgi:cytochrome bd ubiquinol oxidase subunit I